jgi:hypothetical protein
LSGQVTLQRPDQEKIARRSIAVAAVCFVLTATNRCLSATFLMPLSQSDAGRGIFLLRRTRFSDSMLMNAGQRTLKP